MMRTTMWAKARPGRGITALFLAGILGGSMAACAGTPPLPQTRSVITLTGERVQAEPEAMVQVDRWLRPQLDDIERNPGFLVRLLQEDRPLYPWGMLEITGDTVQLSVQQGHGDAETPFLIYAHFRLMAEQGTLEPWLPEAFPEEGSPAAGLELEELILARIADLWLLGRSVFDTSPHGPLDEILYASEGGWLREFIFLAQPDRFEAEATAHFGDRPEREAEFRRWFQRVFEADGPRYVVSPTADDEDDDGEDPPGAPDPAGAPEASGAPDDLPGAPEPAR